MKRVAVAFWGLAMLAAYSFSSPSAQAASLKIDSGYIQVQGGRLF